MFVLVVLFFGVKKYYRNLFLFFRFFMFLFFGCYGFVYFLLECVFLFFFFKMDWIWFG